MIIKKKNYFKNYLFIISKESREPTFLSASFASNKDKSNGFNEKTVFRSQKCKLFILKYPVVGVSYYHKVFYIKYEWLDLVTKKF